MDDFVNPVEQQLTRQVLVVDDDETSLSCLKILLAGEGYRVVTARDAASALEAAKDLRPQIVVTDIGLPDVSGARLMRDLLALYRAKGVALTGYSPDDLKPEEREPFEAILVKPLDCDHLVAILQSLSE
jgi:two-component system CheB/CheR fusion protein